MEAAKPGASEATKMQAMIAAQELEADENATKLAEAAFKDSPSASTVQKAKEEEAEAKEKLLKLQMEAAKPGASEATKMQAMIAAQEMEKAEKATKLAEAAFKDSASAEEAEAKEKFLKLQMEAAKP